MNFGEEVVMIVLVLSNISSLHSINCIYPTRPSSAALIVPTDLSVIQTWVAMRGLPMLTTHIAAISATLQSTRHPSLIWHINEKKSEFMPGI